jgi:hypothetical protein
MNTNWKETGLPYILTDKQITITCPDGHPRSILREDRIFEDVKVAIAEKNWEVIPDLVNPKKVVEDKYSSTFRIDEDKVYIGNEALPYSLSKRIIDFAKNNLPVEPLLNFWANLNLNPSYRSVQQLHEFLEANSHPITSDGCFIAYRRITDDYKDFHTKTVDNSIGATVSMPRNKVNEDPTQTCSYGLHVANYYYASSCYCSGSGKLVAVKVNPRDVVAVPTDYNQAKMRVCEFVVMEEIESEFTNTPLYDPPCGNPIYGAPADDTYGRFNSGGITAPFSTIDNLDDDEDDDDDYEEEEEDEDW